MDWINIDVSHFTERELERVETAMDDLQIPHMRTGGDHWLKVPAPDELQVGLLISKDENVNPE